MSGSNANGQTITVCGNVFRLVETIGRGSYGTVHKAINLSSGAAVAVKLVGKDKLRRPHERQSIEKEIETMRVAVEQFENGHPHIVRLLCTKESQHHIFIVQEYCAGGDLAALMKASNGLSEDQARLYMSQLADFGFARELQSNSMAESVCHATNHLALRRNIQRYYERHGRFRMPAAVPVSPECEELLEALLRPDPRQRISFDDFFRASFLLPPLPTDTDAAVDLASSASAHKQALVAETQPEFDDWAAFSDEYVIVDNEYEDVGRKVLDGHNLNEELEEKLHERKGKSGPAAAEKRPADAAGHPLPPAAAVDELSPPQASVSAECGAERNAEENVSSAPNNGVAAVVETTTTGAATSSKPLPPPLAVETLVVETESNALAGEQVEWGTDDNSLEELLGICYKSFTCGSVGLFVPTPFGDYIANPPYVLGCIVFIEDYLSTADSNPFSLREGTQYHIVTVTSLSSSEASSGAAGLAPAAIEDELPLSQVLTSRSPRHEMPANSSFASVQSVVSSASPAAAQQHQRISFRSFHISHLALFFLKGGKLPYVAFNEGAPHYYLAHESLQAAMQSGGGGGDGSDKTPPAYICGEIIFIDTFQATEDFNPYRLPYGTRFYVVTVANPKKT
ncbi:hypothetical protein PybrP1_009521 [[Pythium] brassicae (nom. inval.)]|nr:hypothetical protein PybrP1_009521 [[Pythium] brassicae (nom. inval.)]